MAIPIIDELVPDFAGPLVQSIYIKGGNHQVEDITERNAILENRRSIGMLVTVAAPFATYQLVDGITNDDWIHVATVAKGSAIAAVDLTAGQTVFQTITVPGIALGDSVKVNLSGGTGPYYIVHGAQVTAADTVRVALFNTHASATQPLHTDGVMIVVEQTSS